MSVDLLDRFRGSDVLSQSQWRPPRRSSRSNFRVLDDITSQSRFVAIPFGEVQLVLDEPPPEWCQDQLAEIADLGSLEADWDSYGALPVAPECAAAAVAFLVGILDRSTPRPSIVPTSRGGIQFEWHRGGADLEIRVESSDVVQVYFADERTGEESEITFSDNLLPLKPLLDRISTSD